MYASQPVQNPVTAASSARAATRPPSTAPTVSNPSAHDAAAAPRNTAPTRLANRGGRESSSGPSPKMPLHDLEVGEARQAVPPSEGQADGELEREQAEQPPGAGRDRDSGRAPRWSLG